MDDRDLLAAAADAALSYVGLVDDRPTTPTPAALAALGAFQEPLADRGVDPAPPPRAGAGGAPPPPPPPGARAALPPSGEPLHDGGRDPAEALRLLADV